MRIGYLTYGLDRSPTGIGRYSLELLSALKKISGGSEIVLLTTEQHDSHNLWNSFERHALPGCHLLPALLTLGNAALSTAIKRYQLDLIHDPNGIAPFLGFGFGAKRIVTIHDAFPYIYPQTHNRLDNWRYHWLLPQSARRADLVLTDSQNSAYDIARYFHLDKIKIKAIPCAVNTAFSPVPDGPQRKTVLNHYKIIEPYLLYLGGLTSRKNIAALLEAFALVRRRFSTLKLVIAGKRQWQTAEIDQTFARLDLSDSVHFTGYIAEADLPALYSMAEAFVFPSLYEGFGLPPLEAMACGTPVITSNVSSLPEVVGDAAITVNPHNVMEIVRAIEMVLSDPQLRVSLRQRGLERAALFSWERTAYETFSSYQKLLATPSGDISPIQFRMPNLVLSSNKSISSEIRLVGSGGYGSVTGLSRYGENLSLALSKKALKVESEGTSLPPIPGFMLTLFQKVGFDLKTFFSTYPVSLSTFSENAIIHLTSQNLASAVAFRKPSRLVITVHDLITLACRHQPEITGYMHFYDKWFDNLSTKGLLHSDFLIADSQYTKQDIIRYLKYPADQIRVIYLGVDHTNFKPLVIPKEFYTRYNLRLDRLYVLYNGSEDPRKNLHRLLIAFKRLSKRFPEAYLLKVGAARFPKERSRLLATAEELGLANKVRFIDQVSDTDLVYFYNLAKVLVFPSLYEGFGLPPLEAMSCGTPVVCSNSAALPEVVGDGAFMADPYNVEALASAIEKVLEDHSFTEQLIKRGLARASEFSWERTARQTLEVYEQFI